VHFIENLFDLRSRRTSSLMAGREAMEYVPPEWLSDPVLHLVLNGEGLDTDDLYRTVEPGDILIVARPPAGGIGEAILISLIVSAVLTGIAYGIQALTAPSQRPLKEELEDSSTYGFDALANTVRPGTRIPIVYGTNRVGGHIINQFQRPARDTSTTDGDAQTGEMHTLIGLCTGPIEQIDSVRIDKNPASDFKGVTIESRLGGLNPPAIEGFRDVVVQRAKDVIVRAIDPPLTFTTENEVDAFEIIFRFAGGLYKLSDRGQFGKKTIELRIEYREVGDAVWIDHGVKRVSASTRNPFDSWFTSRRLDRASYEIRVSRLTADDTKATGFSDCNVLAINEVTEETLSYPRLALLGVRQLPTNQVSGRVPQYDALVKGKRVRVYTTPTTSTEHWSDNPSWCLLDFLTNTFDGLGAWIDSDHVDIQSFIDWAAFCDEMVAVDARGTLEKQFRLNLVLDGSLTAIDAIKQMCATGRAHFLLRGDKWAVRPDKVESPIQLFTMGRINKGSFRVLKQGRADVGNYLMGQFWNESLDYEQDSLPKEDPTLSVLDDQVEATINLLGTTSGSQANRLLNYHMLANRLTRRTIEMEVGVEALAMEAGDVFLVAHDVPGWGYSGKLTGVDVTGSQLTLDREVTIEGGKTYELTVIHASDLIDVVAVTNNPGATRVLSVSGDFTSTPIVGLDYSFGEVQKSTVAYRCTSISKGAGFLRRKLRAREYNAAIYGTDLTVLPGPSTSRLPDPNRIPPNVRDLRALERIDYAEDGTLKAAIDVHFSLPVEANTRALVFWRELGTTGWLQVGEPTSVGYVAITENVRTPGATYEISVVSVAPSGVRKHPDDGVRVSLITEGTIRQPQKIAGFRVDRTSTGLIFSWDALDPVANFDLDYYELRAGALWETAVTIGRTANTSLETAVFTKGTQTFLIKGVNTAGKSSAVAAAVVVTVDARIGENAIITRQEDTAWTGIKQSFLVSAGKLVVDTEAEIVAWRARQQTPAPGGFLIPGGRGQAFRLQASYTTAAFQITAGNAVRCLVASELEVNQIDTNLYWTAAGVGDKSWDSDFSKTRAWAVAPDGRVTVRVEMRFSTTDSAETSFGPWQERPQNIEVAVKWAQARLIVEILDPAFTAEVIKFRIIFDVPDITDSGSVSTSAGGTVAVTYNKTFNNAPKLAVAIQTASGGDAVSITSPTASGFNIECFNGAGSRVVRTVTWNAIGF
jgi:predicted phage tail protein